MENMAKDCKTVYFRENMAQIPIFAVKSQKLFGDEGF